MPQSSSCGRIAPCARVALSLSVTYVTGTDPTDPTSRRSRFCRHAPHYTISDGVAECGRVDGGRRTMLYFRRLVRVRRQGADQPSNAKESAMKVTLKQVLPFAAAAMLSGCASEPPYRVADDKIVIDTPFALQIGSTEYAAAFGDLVHTTASAEYDPETGNTTTSFYHYAHAVLKEPYFGFDRLSLSFKGVEKALDSVSLYSSERGRFNREVPSCSECRKQVEEIARDVERRLGIGMECVNDMDEEDVENGMRRLKENEKSSKDKSCVVASGFVSYEGTGVDKKRKTRYRVSGFYSNRGKFSIDVGYRKPFDFESGIRSWKPGDDVPVYTNNASLLKKKMEEKQAKAHAAAAKLREVLKRTFAVDFDETNKTARTFFEPFTTVKWTPLAAGFEGAAEQQVSRPTSSRSVPHRSFAVRRVYDGDVDEAELEAQAGRFLARLERELGAKVEKCEDSLGSAMKKGLERRDGTGTPAFGDFRMTVWLDSRQFFYGRVGDVSVDVSYLAPRYRRAGDRYEICSRGAVVMKFVQTPNLR